MNRSLMDILACPVCKGTLELSVTQEEEGEIIEGNLWCESCGQDYPIEESIPNLLPPALRS